MTAVSEHDDEQPPEELEDDDEQEPRRPGDSFAHIEASPLPPMTSDGAPMAAGVGMPEPVPAATPENMVCLRGPCRHYWEVVVPFEAGNPQGTWAELRDDSGEPLEAPREILRTCLASPSREFDLSDACVLSCSKWDPISAAEVAALEFRRTNYYQQASVDDVDGIYDDLDEETDT